MRDFIILAYNDNLIRKITSAKDQIRTITDDYKKYMDANNYHYSRFMKGIMMLLDELDDDLSPKKDKDPKQQKLIVLTGGDEQNGK